MAYKSEYLNALQNNFFKCSNKILALGLSVTAIAVFCYLVSHHQSFMPSLRTIGKALNCGTTKIGNAIKSLASHNVINISKKTTPNGKKNFYSINPDTHWKLKVVNRSPRAPTEIIEPTDDINPSPVIVEEDIIIASTKKNIF